MDTSLVIVCEELASTTECKIENFDMLFIFPAATLFVIVVTVVVGLFALRTKKYGIQ